MAADLRKMRDEDEDAAKVIEVAKGLEGLRRQDGIHAAAVVITKEPLTTYLPIQRKPEGGQDPEDAPIVTQYEMHGVEELGLLKMDFLGLRNLDVISDTVEIIRDTRGVDLDIDAIPLDDPPTYEMLRRGEGIGIFQLEGGPMRALMRSLAPTSFEDICALLALYRPGPMAANMHNDYADRKNGRKPIEHLHPDAEEVLGDTYGLMIYQESLLRVAQKFAGFSLADADLLRRACGKKKRDLIALEREKFIAGCEATGYGAELGGKYFDIIEPFADYAFAKSHAYGYGYIAYQTAYLKANYPAEYLAALLTSVKANLDKAAVYLAECRTMGIEVLVPDVNRSVADFTPVVELDADAGTEKRSIVFGLSAVRNVGVGSGRAADRRARGQRALRRLLRLRRAGRLPGAQQEDDRVADQGGRLRQPRAPAPGAAAQLRAHHRHHRRPPPRARHGRDVAVRRDRGRRPDVRRAAADPRRSSSPSGSASASRRRCSASTSATTR